MSDTTAIEFLKLIQPLGPWCLCCQKPDKSNAFTGARFSPDEADDCERWIAEQNSAGNQIWYRAAAIKQGVNAAYATDADVIGTRIAWVDIDPSADCDRDTERANILRVLTTDLPANVKPPSLIIDSGNGFQSLYILKEPWKFANDDEREDFRAINRWLAGRFGAEGGDKCFSPNHLLRLPWTTNWKRKIGDTFPVASIVKSDGPNEYGPNDFERIKNTVKADKSADTTNMAIGRLEHIDDLDAKRVPQWVRILIVQGWDVANPNLEIVRGYNNRKLDKKPKPWDSRSEAVYWLVGHLLGKNVDEGIILNILTDDRWGISEHCRANGGEKYARKQIDNWKSDHPEPEKIVVDIDAKPGTRDLARGLLASRNGEPIIHLNSEFHIWRSGAYQPREENTIRKETYEFLENIGSKPHPKSVSAVFDALISLTLLDKHDVAPPCWVNGSSGPDPKELIVCRNGLLHLPTGELRPHTPDYLTFNVLDYNYSADAPKPEAWLNFLAQLWPEGQTVEIDGKEISAGDNILELKKMFGYCLTLDTSQQKMFGIFGPRRCGKGTILRVLRALVGQHNSCSPSLNQFGQTHGRQVLIGKQLATIADLRIGPKADKDVITETLLNVTGEDSISIPRKFLTDWEGTLRTRFIILSNDPPKLPDASGALAGRFIVLQIRQSFYGREDRTLTDKLLKELPGIFNWAIDGWRMLQKDGCFKQPESARQAFDQLDRMSSPVRSFVQDYCEFNPTFITHTDTLYLSFVNWARGEGLKFWPTKEIFGKDITAAYGADITPCKPTIDGRRMPGYRGIRIKEDLKQVYNDVLFPDATTTAE